MDLFNGRQFGEAIVEAPITIQTYLEQGKQYLAQGQAREAAIAYAHGAQLEPNNAQIHLGLAEANLALGNYNVVQMACQRVQELQAYGGEESLLAHALLNVLERRYEEALQDVDTLISQNPSIAYTHALRSYLLRALGRDYDANIARTKATRLSFGGRFDNCFPPPSGHVAGYNGTSGQTAEQVHNSVSPWSNRSNLDRQIVRTRFALSQYQGLITYSIIAINVIIYLIVGIRGGNLVDISGDTIFLAGGQNSPWIQASGEYWRIFTAMFLHFDLTHIGLNMLSLFIIGRVVETIYGKLRYLIIYLSSGIIGGIVTYFYYLTADPNAVSAGASGAIFGVFGALGVFYLMNRGSYGRGAIGNWLFWLGLNLVWGLSVPGIGIVDHIGGLLAGMVLAFLLMPRTSKRKA